MGDTVREPLGNFKLCVNPLGCIDLDVAPFDFQSLSSN